MNNTTLARYNNYILVSIFFSWIIYTISYGILRTKPETSVIAGYLSLVGEAGLDFIAAFLTLYIWKKSNVYKKLFFVFALSFLTAGIADFIYNLVLNVYQVTSFEITADSLWDIPFAVFLCLQTIAWCLLFFSNFDKYFVRLFSYFPYALAGAIIFSSFVFGISWKIHYLSVLGVYQIIDTLLEALGFVFASFCLIRSNIPAIRYLSIGYLLIISSDFIIRYGVVTATLKPSNPLETTWVLGLLFTIVGFFFFRERDYKKSKC